MNIDDVKAEDIQIPSGDLWPKIMDEQHRLAVKYSDIERRNGFFYPAISDLAPLEDGQFQQWIKNFFWRTTEEIGEALEVLPDSWIDWKSRFNEDTVLRHFLEEIADATHFLMEVSMVVKMSSLVIQQTWNDVVDRYKGDPFRPAVSAERIERCAGKFLFKLGQCANTLKNKPWKTTQMRTDVVEFHHRLSVSWAHLMMLYCILGCDESDIYVLYMRKNAVNHFRQRTKY